MCFSLQWLEQILIYAVIVCAIVAILRLFVPWILGQFGVGGGMVMQMINIMLWAVVCIFVIWIAFGLISCLLSMGGGTFLPHR